MLYEERAKFPPWPKPYPKVFDFEEKLTKVEKDHKINDFSRLFHGSPTRNRLSGDLDMVNEPYESHEIT